MVQVDDVGAVCIAHALADLAEVEIIGMNAATETIVDKLAIHDKPGAMDKLMSH